MALVKGFLSAAECAHIIRKAREWLHPSRVVNHESSGDTGQLSNARTSSSCKARQGRHAPKLQPHVPRLQPRAPRLQPRVPRLQPHVPRLQPHVPRLRPHVYRWASRMTSW